MPATVPGETPVDQAALTPNARRTGRIRRTCRTSLVLVFPALLVAALAPSQAPVRFEFSEVHMGMPVRLVLYAGEEATARAAAAAAFARIGALDGALSDYRPESELNRVSDAAGSWVPVSGDLRAVLTRARELSRATGGAFDPTVGPLVALWREARATGRLPEPDILARARVLVDWRRLELDALGRRVRLVTPGMRLDLGGIAKGFILDEARAVLKVAGVTRVFLEAGGDVLAGDPPPGSRGWRVEVPGAHTEFAARAAELSNAALATSGPTFQSVRIDGVTYSHVVSPFTGLGLTERVVVHVIAPDGAAADALATAISVIGRDCAREVIALFPGVIVVEVGERAPCRRAVRARPMSSSVSRFRSTR